MFLVFLVFSRFVLLFFGLLELFLSFLVFLECFGLLEFFLFFFFLGGGGVLELFLFSSSFVIFVPVVFCFSCVFGVFYVYDGSSSVLGYCVWFIQLHFSREQRRRFLMS